jgi:hypothetical protein
MLFSAMILTVFGLSGQVQPPPAPWRGAGPTPCVGSDGGVYQCPPAPRAFAIRAGRLFDTGTGQMLTKRRWSSSQASESPRVGPDGRASAFRREFR